MSKLPCSPPARPPPDSSSELPAPTRLPLSPPAGGLQVRSGEPFTQWRETHLSTPGTDEAGGCISQVSAVNCSPTWISTGALWWCCVHSFDQFAVIISRSGTYQVLNNLNSYINHLCSYKSQFEKRNFSSAAWLNWVVPTLKRSGLVKDNT